MRKRKTRNRSSGDDGEGLSLPDTSYDAEPEVTPGLVPTGIPGIYQSPVEPVDPYDCERWPDSPYCGGSLLQDELISLTPQISINPCETCVTFTPVLAKISLPPYTICKRKNSPECKERPTDPDWGRIPEPENFPQSIPANLYNNRCKDGSTFVLGVFLDKSGGNNPVFTDINEYFRWYHSGENVSGDIGRGGSIYAFQNLYQREIVKDGAVIYDINHPEYGSFVDATMWEDVIEEWGIAYRNEYYWIKHKERFYSPRMKISFRTRGFYVGVPPAMQSCYIVQPYNIQIFDLPCETASPPALDVPYPNERRSCCMSCCNSREQEENNELLRLIARRLGTNDYPFTVPANLLASRSRSAKKLESNAQVWEWFIRQFDALAGQFPIEIEIEDADPTKQGDQAAKIKVDNISEALAELLGISINTSINTESLVNIGVRTLTEAGMAKNAAIVAQDLGLANAEFLDYELKQITRKIPSTFTPGKVELDDILQESTQQIRSYENVDDHQLKDYLTELLQGVAIIRAAFWRKLDPNKPYSSQIRSLLRNLVNLSDNDLTKDENGRPKEKTPTEDFDSFLEQVEMGFTDEAGIQDATKPYGRNLESRPRIRELGDQSER